MGGSTGVIEKKMQTTMQGLYRDNGKTNVESTIQSLYRDDGKKW